MTSPIDEDAAVFRTLKRLTNGRQAAKVADVRQTGALVAQWDPGRTVYVRAVDAGLLAVGYGSGGGLYMSRILTPPQVTKLVDGADDVDAAHSYDDMPRHVSHPGGGR